ncbi:MAG: hypothetical protein IJX43_03555 [Alphaproteobacteria bacterium]|nr:hypothetical protein [Alphaproteobacteria bacterium]
MKPQSPIILDGKKVEELCVFGDGDAQLALYNAVKEYTLKNTTDIRRGMQPDKNPNYQCDVIVAKSARYDVVVARRYVPNVSTLFATQRYQVQINDKHINQTYNHMGTMAHMMFDFLQGIKGSTR